MGNCGCNNEPISECCSSKRYYAEETEYGLELREIPKELNQYKAHLVDTGIGKRDAEDMMQLIIKHMHDQNEILDQIRLELKNLRKIGGI